MIFSLNSLPAIYLDVIEKIEALRNQAKYSTSDNRRRWTGLLRSTFALSIQGSNSIEGYNVTYEDAMNAVDGEEPLDAKEEAWLAVKGYRDALTYVLQLADDPHYAHNEGTLRGLHFMMLSHDIAKHPGRWRPGAVWVTREATGETVYEGPDISIVPGLMGELIQSLNAKSKLPTIAMAALAHLNLVMIHPFSDGNGRMGRALQTLVLARQGIIDPRFSSIEEMLARFTPQYYQVLGEVGGGKWHPENDSLPFIRFCLVLHHQQGETLLSRIRQIDRVWNGIEEEGKRRKLNERTFYALGDAALGIRVTNSRYRKYTEVSDQVASKDLKILTEHGLLVPKGEKRGRHYVAGDWLFNLRKQVSEKIVFTNPFEESESKQLVQEFLPGLAPSSNPGGNT